MRNGKISRIVPLIMAAILLTSGIGTTVFAVTSDENPTNTPSDDSSYDGGEADDSGEDDGSSGDGTVVEEEEINNKEDRQDDGTISDGTPDGSGDDDGTMIDEMPKNADGKTGMPNASAPSIDKVRIETGTTQDFGRGDYVAVRTGKNAWFAVVYGTEDAPNAVSLISVYTRYLGVADVQRPDRREEKEVGIPVRTVFAQRLERIVEFDDGNNNSAFDTSSLEEGVEESPDDAGSDDTGGEDDTNAAGSVEREREGERETGSDSGGMNEETGTDEYEVPDRKRRVEKVYKSADLRGGWTLRGPELRSANNTDKVWEFGLFRKDIPYDFPFDAEADDSSYEEKKNGIVLDKVEFTFRVKVSVRNITVEGIPRYDVNVSDNGITTEHTGSESYEGRSVEASFKYDHDITGWDVAGSGEDDGLPGRTNLFVGSRTLMGNHLSPYAAIWLKRELLGEMNGEGYAEYADSDDMPRRVGREDETEEPVVVDPGTRRDIKDVWERFEKGEITREELLAFLADAIKHGDITRAGLKEMLIKSYGSAGVSDKKFVSVLFKASEHGMLSREESLEVLLRLVRSGALTRERSVGLLILAHARENGRGPELVDLLLISHARNVLDRENLIFIFGELTARGLFTKEEWFDIFLGLAEKGIVTEDEWTGLLTKGYRQGILNEHDLADMIAKNHDRKGREEKITRVLTLLYFRGVLSDHQWIRVVMTLYERDVLGDKDLIVVLSLVCEKRGKDKERLVRLFSLIYKGGKLERETWTRIIAVGFRSGVLSTPDLPKILFRAHEEEWLNGTELIEVLWFFYVNEDLPSNEWLLVLALAYDKGMISQRDWHGVIYRVHERDLVEKEEMMRFMLFAAGRDLIDIKDWTGMILSGRAGGTFTEEDTAVLLALGYRARVLIGRGIAGFIKVAYDRDELTADGAAALIISIYEIASAPSGVFPARMTLDDLRFLLFVPLANLTNSVDVNRDAITEALLTAVEREVLTDEQITYLLRTAFLRGLMTRGNIEDILLALQKEGALVPIDADTLIKPSQALVRFREIMANHTPGTGSPDGWAGKVLGIFVRENKSREEIRYAVFSAYVRGNITFGELLALTEALRNNDTLAAPLITYAWFVIRARVNDEIRLLTVKELLLGAFTNGTLSRDDLLWVLSDALKRNRLTRKELGFILFCGFEDAQVMLEDVEYLLFTLYDRKLLTLHEVSELLAGAISDGYADARELARLLSESYNSNKCNLTVLRKLFVAAYAEGIFDKEDIFRILQQVHNGTGLDIPGMRKVVLAIYLNRDMAPEHFRWLLFRSYGAGIIDGRGLRALLMRAFKDADMSREDVGKLVFEAYNHSELNRSELKRTLIGAYLEGNLTREDLRRLLTRAYEGGKLTRKDLKWVIFTAYRLGELTRGDVKWLLVRAYSAGELSRKDVKFLLIRAHLAGELSLEDLRWLILRAYEEGELTREDLRWLIFTAYKEGELSLRALRWLTYKALGEGELTRNDVAWLLVHAYRAGELDRANLVEILRASLEANEARNGNVAALLILGHRLGVFNEEDIAAVLFALHNETLMSGKDILFVLVFLRRAASLSLGTAVRVLTKTYRAGGLTKEKLALLLIWSYKRGHLDEKEIRYVLIWFRRHGELTNFTGADLEFVLNRLHKAKVALALKLSEILKERTYEVNTVDFADNWQRVGRLSWVSDARIWSNGSDNTSAKVPVYFQIHGVRKVAAAPGWAYHGRVRGGVFIGFSVRGGYLYPAAYRVFHDPNVAARANYFSPPGGAPVEPETDEGRLSFEIGNRDSANIPLNKNDVAEVEFRDRSGRSFSRGRFKGEGTVEWRALDKSGIPSRASGDVPKDMRIVGRCVEAELDGDLDWYYLEVEYDEGDLGEDVEESSLRLYFWDENSDGWQLCENTRVDMDANIVYANVTHFTIFAPMAQQRQIEGDGGGEDGAPVTMIVLLVLAGIFVVVAVVGIYVRRKRREETEEEEWEEELPIHEEEVDWSRYQD